MCTRPLLHRTPFAAAALVVALGAAACRDDVTAPLDEPGRYVLRSIDGRPLPATVDSSATEFGILLADTIRLDGRGTAIRSFSYRRVSVAQGEAIYRPTMTLEYRLGPGWRISIGRFQGCGPQELCAPNDEGVRTAERLEIVSRRYGWGQHLLFRRSMD